MIRSTPSSSGSGNITPASTRMAVSPQAITIMFMPNSPTPPSGTISSGGMSMPGESAGLIRQQPSVGHEDRWIPARRSGRQNLEHGNEPAVIRADGPCRAAAGSRGFTRVFRQPAGTGHRSSGRTIARRMAGSIRKLTSSPDGPAANWSASAGQLGEFQRLRPARWIDAGGLERVARPAGPRASGERRQRVGQRLPPLREHRPDHRLEHPFVAGRRCRRPERQPDHRRVDLGRRTEGARRQASARGGRRHAAAPRWTARRSRRCPGALRAARRPPAAASGSRPRSAGLAGSGLGPLGVRAGLKTRPCSRARSFDQPEQDWRRDVVGQVAGDAQRAGRQQRGQDPARGSRATTRSTFGGSRGPSAQRGRDRLRRRSGARPAAPA